MAIFYVDLHTYCGLLEARSLKSAYRSALREHGTRSLREVREATDEDINSIAAMGGWVPDSARRYK